IPKHKRTNSTMDIFSNSFFRRIIFLGIVFLKEVSCREFPIVHIDPAHLSSILQDEQMVRELTRALSEVQPLLLQTSPEREFYQLHHPNAAVHSFSANTPPNKKDTRHSSTNNRPDFAKPAIVTLPDPRPRSSNLFPTRRELEPKFPSLQLTYGFVPRAQKSELSSPKRENNGFHKSQTRNFAARRSNSEMPPFQNLKLQKTEQNNRREQEAKNKQISALRDRPSQFPSREPYYRSNWDDSDSKRVEGDAFHVKPHHNAERGQESVRRPTTLIGNSQISFAHHRKESDHYKQEYQELPSRQNKNANKKSGNERTTKRPLSFVNFALKVNLRDTPAYKVNGANVSLLDEPVALYRNPELYSQLGEMEKKRYIVFKATTMVTTKRPSSAPFTATSFFRNVPQSSPRDVTLLPPEYSPQVSAVLPLKPSSTPAMKPAASAHTVEDKAETTTSSYSHEYNNDDFQVTGLKEGKTLLPYVGHPDEDLNYEEDPFGDVMEVYSHDSFEFPLDSGPQTQGNSSFLPISSPSSASYAVHQNNDGKSQWKKPEAKKSSLKKSFSNAKSKTTEDTDADDGSGAPGQPGTDYPNYYEIPLTNFDCKEYHAPGFYADVEAGCQVFHNCDTDLQKHSFLCPNGTVFRQELFICDWWYNVRCEDSPDHFPLNDGLYIHP
ncbi:hypothetical protein AVEN_203874-1, partial [Araneus ventricosus]